MTYCTRTRPTRRTLNPISDILWQREQDNETRFIAAQESARAPQTKDGNWPTISEILRTYTFAPYELGTLSQGGRCIQAAMTVTNPTDASDRYLVQCNLLTGKWQCYCPPAKKDGRGVLFIECVQRRVQAHRQARLAQAA